ncbi:MAG: hypothetical protein JKY54_17625 [Flavobacteriales bacterium]|nr:hypothetical protein [Flavobacteriales bacterium]
MKKLFTLVLFFLIISPLFAQYQKDFGITIGGSNYLGDIGGDELNRGGFIWDMKMEQTGIAVGAFYRTKLRDNLGIKASVHWARIQGDDVLSSNAGRRGRNLNFRNDLIELAATGEYYFYETYDVGGYGRYLVEFRPYLFGGIAAVYSDPKAELDGEYYALRPLNTEGKSNSYNAITMSIPGGLGFYFTYANRYRLGWELGYRHTFTDYLDDVSGVYASVDEIDSELGQQLANRRPELGNEPLVPNANNYESGEKRGDQSHNDSYLFSEFSLSYVLRGAPYPIWIKNGGRKSGVRVVRYKSKYGRTHF